MSPIYNEATISAKQQAGLIWKEQKRVPMILAMADSPHLAARASALELALRHECIARLRTHGSRRAPDPNSRCKEILDERDADGAPPALELGHHLPRARESRIRARQS